MTPKVDKASAPARKITPVASKTWKENLRRACLDRARRGRSCITTNILDQNNQVESNGVSAAARDMIEDELRQREIAIHSLCSEDRFQLTRGHDPADCSMDTVEEEPLRDAEVPRANHFITEEELFELLAEVEEEIEREEALRLEERIRHEMEYLHDQVSDFERWEETKQQQDTPLNVAVLCPICHEENLVQSLDRSIVCPNCMDGSCSMQLDNIGLTLPELQERMRASLDEHSLYCHHYLSFNIQEGHLRATCSACDTRMEIV